MTRIVSIALLVSALSIFATAQVTYISGPSAPSMPGIAKAAYSPSAAYLAGDAAPFANVPLPNAGLLTLPPDSGFLGGMASDDRNGILYTSNGIEMAMDQNQTYLGFGPLPLVPAVTVPIPFPAGVSNLTGLCFDDGSNALWATSGSEFWQMQPIPPFSPLTLALPIPGIASSASGLGWDPATNSLYACSTGGGIYNFTTAGAPIGAQPINFVSSLGPLQGLAVNKSNGPGAFGAPSCSIQTTGYHVTVSDGISVYDALTPMPPIVLDPNSMFEFIYGHTYSSDFQTRSCVDPSPLPCTPSRAGTQRVNYVGPGSTQALRCVGAPPLTPGFLIADLCPLSECFAGFWLNPLTWGTLAITTNAFGEHTLPLNMTSFPPGLQFSFQYAVFDLAAPLSYCFSNLCTLTVGLP